MDLEAIRTRLIEIESPLGIQGFLRSPFAISEADLPVALHPIRQATHDQESLGEQINQETRTMLIRVLVKPLGAGISQEAEEEVEAYLDPMIQALLAHPSLTSVAHPTPLATIQRMSLVSDQGITVIPYPDPETRYLGLEFTIRLIGNINYSYADGE